MRDEPGLFHALSDTISRATELVQLEFKVLEIFVVAACYYLAMTSLWGVVQRRLEAHFGRPYGSSGEPPRRIIDRTLLEQDAR